MLAGVVALWLGASRFVAGASDLAARVGIPPLVVGLTVVALGTSLPEFAVTVGSALAGGDPGRLLFELTTRGPRLALRSVESLVGGPQVKWRDREWGVIPRPTHARTDGSRHVTPTHCFRRSPRSI